MKNNKVKIAYMDVGKYGFVVEPRYYWWGWSKSPAVRARKSALEALLKAKSFLPKGFNFKIWDCQRSREIQIRMMVSFKRRLELAYPKASKKKIIKLVELFGGDWPPLVVVKTIGGHRYGGAFDLTVIDSWGNELYMGTDHDDLTPKARTNYFENRMVLTLLDREAKKNRRLMIKVMKKAGFKNYAPEWWHWGYDK